VSGNKKRQLILVKNDFNPGQMHISKQRN